MARIWFEGFDNQNDETDLLNGVITAAVVPSGGALALAPGRFTGKAVQLTTTQVGVPTYFTRKNSALAQGFNHWAIYLPTAAGTGGDAYQWIAFYDSTGSGAQVSFAVDSLTGTIFAFTGFGAGTFALTGTTPIGQSVAGVISPGTWYSLELSALIALTTGSTAVHMNGAVVAGLTLSNVATQTTANANFDTVMQGVTLLVGTSATALFDDAWLNDATGASNNTFPGPGSVVTRFATADNAVQWTPKTAELNYMEINETAMDGDASYNSATTPGDQDTFTSTTVVPTGWTPVSLKVQRASRADVPTMKTDENVLISGATTVTGGSLTENTVYTYVDFYADQDPAISAAWTSSAILATKWGYQQTA